MSGYAVGALLQNGHIIATNVRFFYSSDGKRLFGSFQIPIADAGEPIDGTCHLDWDGTQWPIAVRTTGIADHDWLLVFSALGHRFGF